MSILVDTSTRVLVQGITGRDGSFHTRKMKEYGTNVVAGVTPGKGGTEVEGVPVFDTVADAVAAVCPTCSVIYVPAGLAADAMLEAAEARIPLVVCITEGLPALDVVRVKAVMQRFGIRLIGPNCPGVISPGRCKVGIMPGSIHQPGSVGVVSRSGTLTYEVVAGLSKDGLGQSSALGIGGDPVIGTTFLDALELFQKDLETLAVVMIGEIGGNDEERAAEFIKREMTKPVVAFIAGRMAPPGKRMGHAGAIIAGGKGTAAEKTQALEDAGVPVARVPSEIPGLLRQRGIQ
ncbi:succinate--CoA ligase subunit alpha [Candidatus Fermentibacteria bacterium]|nr:succinate--CoA ligase subunit alpha [Candidatus Fermentibacteria bacterium]